METQDMILALEGLGWKSIYLHNIQKDGRFDFTKYFNDIPVTLTVTRRQEDGWFCLDVHIVRISICTPSTYLRQTSYTKQINEDSLLAIERRLDIVTSKNWCYP